MKGLRSEDYTQIRKELDDCSRPVYLFGNDTDGLASFLLLYRYKREGKSVPVKSAPVIDEKFVPMVTNYDADKVFILDIPEVDEAFINAVKVPIVWIDHHDYVPKKRVKYFNPKKYNPVDNTSTSELCYHAVENDLWIAVLGIVGDWQLSEVTKEFSKRYPELLSSKIKDPAKALFDTKLGELIRLFQFMLKGDNKKVVQSIKILTRMDDPHELLNGTTPASRWLHKRYKPILKDYFDLLEYAKSQSSRKKMLVVVYEGNKMSFTGELANELFYLYPKKVIIVARHKSGEMRCSFRAADYDLPKLLGKALENVQGYGGGHLHSCGGAIKEDSWKLFLEQMESQL